MTIDYRALGTELSAMATEDLRVRGELAGTGELFCGYHPRMREIHRRNARRLLAIIDTCGWPGKSRVGAEAADAAWLILQHAIDNPSLQRRGLELLTIAVRSGDVERKQVAMLEDRIRINEGKPQWYGTQFDWDRSGHLSPLPIEDAANVDRRRAALGLCPIDHEIAQKRRAAAANGECAPEDWQARQEAQQEWRRSTGWLE